jgi:type II secretory pathway predicted ATPase ExeA
VIKDYFGLTETPFTKYVPAANLFHSQAWQELSARLDHIVKNRALGVITGEVGAGKSTAVRALSSRLDPIRYPFIYIADSGLGPRGFYREVLSQFGVTPAFYQRDARRQFDHVFMDAYENQGKQPVLVIDEAHLLSASMLAEVRFLTLCRVHDYAEEVSAVGGHTWEHRDRSVEVLGIICGDSQEHILAEVPNWGPEPMYGVMERGASNERPP